MSEKTIGVGDIIKDFREKLEKEREEVKRLREAIDNIAKGMDEDWRHWRNELKRVIE